MSVQVTLPIPKPSDLPADWKTTLFGVITAAGKLYYDYATTHQVTWEGAAVAVLIATIFYFLPAKMKPTPAQELDLTEKVTAIVTDILAKQPVLPDVESLVAAAVQDVQAAFSANASSAVPVSSVPPLLSAQAPPLAPVTVTASIPVADAPAGQ